MSCKTRRVTLNPSPYPDNTMSRRFCQPFMGAVYDAGEEPTLRVWDPSNPVTHPNCMCTYVPIGPPEIVSGTTLIEAAGTYTYIVKCGPTPYSCGVDDDSISLSEIRLRDKNLWEHPKVEEFELDVLVAEPCEDDFFFTLTVSDKDDNSTQLEIEVACGCCTEADYLPPSLLGEEELIAPGLYAFSTENGCNPFTWTVDPESEHYEINQSGELWLSDNACGSLAVIATDRCDNQTRMDVRIVNNGKWVAVCAVSSDFCDPGVCDTFTYPSPDPLVNCPARWGTTATGTTITITEYSGRYKYVYKKELIWTDWNPYEIPSVSPCRDQSVLGRLAALTGPFLDKIIPKVNTDWMADHSCDDYPNAAIAADDVEYVTYDIFGFRFYVPRSLTIYEWQC